MEPVDAHLTREALRAEARRTQLIVAMLRERAAEYARDGRPAPGDLDRAVRRCDRRLRDLRRQQARVERTELIRQMGRTLDMARRRSPSRAG